MKDRAKALRKSSTDAEKLLWRSLRNRQLAGWKFRRQHPIGNYIVDFGCLERKLVIEVDGGQHAEKLYQDAKRSDDLKKKGFEVLRFWNNEVLQESEAVLNVILASLSQSTPSPLPSPPISGGEGD